MDLYERETSTLNTVNRLNARIAALTANSKELYVRQEIARDLLLRGQNKPELILLVLGDTETADNLVASGIAPHRVEWIANDTDNDNTTWERYVCMKIMAQRAAMGATKPNTDIPAPAEDETEDDLPVGFDDKEDNLEFPEEESEVDDET